MTKDRIRQIAEGVLDKHWAEPAIQGAIEAAIIQALGEAFIEGPTPEMQLAGFEASKTAKHDVERFIYAVMCVEKLKQWSE